MPKALASRSSSGNMLNKSEPRYLGCDEKARNCVCVEMHNYESARIMLEWSCPQRRIVKTNQGEPEENENTGWRAMPIAWIASEAFAPSMMRRQVGARLLMW